MMAMMGDSAMMMDNKMVAGGDKMARCPATFHG